MRYTLSLFFALLLSSGYAQLRQEFAWQAELLSTRKKVTRLYEQWQKGGYKLASGELEQGRLVWQVTDVSRLGRLLKKKYIFTFELYDGTTLALNGKEIRTFLAERQQLVLDTVRGNTEQWYKAFRAALRGRSSYKGPAPPTWKIGFGPFATYNDHIKLTITKRGKKELMAMHFWLVPGSMALALPELEDAPCVPVDRLLTFEKVAMPPTYKPVPYKLPEGRKFSRRFTLHFAHNSAHFSPAEVAAIKAFLQNENLEIRGAFIRGMSSIEGDSVRNRQLQEQRAAVLWQTLAPYRQRGARLQGDYQPAYRMFRQQMRAAGITLFDSLSDSEINRLFYNPDYRQQYASYLAAQRVARMSIQLYKHYTPAEQVTRAYAEATRQYAKIVRARSIRSRSEREQTVRKAASLILGIERALTEAVRQGRLTTAVVRQYYHTGKLETDELVMSRFNQVMADWNRGLAPVVTDYPEIILKAYRVTLPLVTSPEFSRDNLALHRAVAVQMFAYGLIRKGVVDVHLYDELTYPEELPYYHLLLNRITFANVYGIDNGRPGVPRQQESGVGGRLANASSLPDKLYYNFVKKNLLINHYTAINPAIAAKDEYYYFDLYYLLFPNVMGWQVFDDKRFDEDITIAFIDRMIDHLLTTKICPDNIYELALTFHLKVLQQATRATRMTPQIRKSYDFIASYYKTHAGQLTPALANRVAGQLLFLGHLFYRNENVQDAYELMQVTWKNPD
ncbi:MAG TPA: hypothetical protein ENJ39_02730, partial [Flammeovirgaceae bacterium]|nr:hypothetical protein [Flammeovirgaceae bacterium]